MTFARRPLAEAVFWSVPVVLFLPTLYYSLTTPFGLVDDYHSSLYASVFDSVGRFDPAAWSSVRNPARHRPFWDFQQAVAWTVFGPVPWLHHLARWLTVAGAVFAFTAAFSAFPSAAPTGRGPASAFLRLLPRALLVHLWVFFPNQPAARLVSDEVNTVFFMGLCTWMTARMLVRRDRKGAPEAPGSMWPTHGLFVLGCVGLLWSKEVNVAVALWMLIFYCAPLLKGMDRTRIAGGLVLAAVVVHTARTVSGLWEAGGYGTAPLTPQLALDNARWIAAGLFQVDTSPVIFAGLAVLSALLPIFVAGRAGEDIGRALGDEDERAGRSERDGGGDGPGVEVQVVARAGRRMRFSSELLFVLFLLGQFASLYLVLCTSWTQAPRYWYSLVPVFTALVAFSAKFMLEFFAPSAGVSVRPPRAQLAAACALAGFVLFFIGCNYSNALLQTVVQHRARHTEKALLAEITRLLDRGRHVQVMDFAEGDELMQSILVYYRWFLPRFEGRKYDIHDIRTPVPSNYAGEPRYWVAHGADNLPLPHDAVNDYPLLSRARDVAAVLQSDTPHWTYDHGGAMRRWYVASTDPGYGRDGVRRVGPEGPHEPAGDLDLDARLDNSISRYIRERAVSGSLFSNDFPSVSHIHGHDSALQVYDGLPCVESLRSAESPHDVHVAWFFSRAGGERSECVDLAQAPQPLEMAEVEWRWAGDGVIEVRLLTRNRRGPWRWQRADAMPDDSGVPDNSTWADVDDEWGRSWQYALAPDDEGRFLRAHVEYEDEGRLMRRESAVIGPIILGPRGPTVARGATRAVDLWESSVLELAADLDDGFIFKVTRSGVSAFRAEYGRVVTSGEPVVDSFFDVYLRDGQLTYVKGDGCTAELTRAPFFLHVSPVSTNALAPSRREHGFDAFSFDFHRRGAASEGMCFMTVPLPGYAVSGIRTGQSTGGGDVIWAGAASWNE